MSTQQSVVLITVDCLRADHVGCYGYDRPTTPRIDALADNASVFEYSYSNSPGTRWALQVLHTGVHTQQIDGLGIPDEGVSLAKQFAQDGYATGGFAKNGFLSREYNYNRGFDAFSDVTDFATKQHPIKRAGKRLNETLNNNMLRSLVFQPLNDLLLSTQGPTSGYRPAVTDEEVCTHALEWIRSQQSTETPFFVWIHLMNAHTPYARWNDHLRALRGDTAVEHVINPHSEVTVGERPPEAVTDAYDAGIRSADEQIGRVLDELNEKTVVAITGDHGEEFGEYNPFHTASLYSTMTQVPLIIRAPELDAGRIGAYPVQHLDIFPTLSAAADLESLPNWQGEPLQYVERSLDSTIHFGLDAGQYGIRTGEWKLIRSDFGSDELYNTPHHGYDEDDVSAAYPAVCDKLVTIVDEHIRWMDEHKYGTGKVALREGADDLSTDVRENLEELGYL